MQSSPVFTHELSESLPCRPLHVHEHKPVPSHGLAGGMHVVVWWKAPHMCSRRF